MVSQRRSIATKIKFRPSLTLSILDRPFLCTAPCSTTMERNMTHTEVTAMKSTRMSTRNRPRSHSLETVRNVEFWYDDGTLILLANNIEFRVYRGPLAKHSQVFRNMLSFPQPPTPGPSQASSSRVALESDLSHVCQCPGDCASHGLARRPQTLLACPRSRRGASRVRGTLFLLIVFLNLNQLFYAGLQRH